MTAVRATDSQWLAMTAVSLARTILGGRQLQAVAAAVESPRAEDTGVQSALTWNSGCARTSLYCSGWLQVSSWTTLVCTAQQ